MRNISEAMSTRKPPKRQKSKSFSGAGKTAVSKGSRPRKDASRPSGDNWLYGDHAVFAVLKNPSRKIRRLVIGHNKLANLSPEELGLVQKSGLAESVDGEIFEQLLPEGAVHQSIAVQAAPLPDLAVEDIVRKLEEGERCALAVLDQVTDPHNVGAILRSAAAFDIDAVIVPDRHSPPLTGVLARAASGAVESVPVVRVNNLSRTLDYLAENGFWRIGMDGRADKSMEEAVTGLGRIVVVLGSEGKGLRRLTAEKCDLLAKLPMNPRIESLNVSNAAAIAFYEVAKRT
ncbi:23S rRNA (guanosine(2251)-2'-O)-methyltransferase RlmB [Sneathiella chinensis]|nr:23S rRNA (guanosine(2251)-2'-O)-methyltransferase RlmB [Sneathiella chinensis]